MKGKIKDFAAFVLKKEKTIAVIFLLGLFLRLLGTYPGYPLTHPDEPTIGTPSIRIAFEGNFRPQNYYYGSLLSLIYAATYIIFFIPLSFIFTLPITPPQFLSNGLFGFFDYLKTGPPLHQLSFWSTSYWARYDSAIISSFTVIIAYLVGKRLFNKPIALIVAFLIAVNYRHVLSSRLILADAPAATFAMLAVLLCVILLEKPNLRRYILAGAGLGLALSVKYFIYVLPTFLLCHLFASWQTAKFNIGNIAQKLLHYKLFIALFICVLLFILINPYLLLARDEAAYFWAANSSRYGLTLSLDTLKNQNLSYYSLYYLFHYGLGPELIILTGIGFLWSLFRFPKSTLILASVAFPYIYTFLVISGTGMVRNYAAIIPFLLFFPAVFIFDFIKLFFKKTRLAAVFAIFLIITVSLNQIKNSLISGLSLAQEQNMISLYKWMDRNIPEGSKILGPSGIFYPSKSLEATKLTLEGNNLLAMEEVKKSTNDWIILNSIPADSAESLLLTPKTARDAFFNSKILEDLSLNNYSSLVFQEFANYRAADFAKQFSQDPPFMIARIPKFWETKEDREVTNFKSKNPFENWSYDYYPVNSYEYLVTNNSTGFKQTTPHCNSIFTKFSSPKFPINPGNWYTLTASTTREFNPLYKTTRNGFFRLDFYSDNGEKLKTYVSRTLPADKKPQKLSAAGFAPKNSSTAGIIFQIDSCLEGESYALENVRVFSAYENPEVDQEVYPNFGENHNRNFEWVPQL